MTVGWFVKGMVQYADFYGRARRSEFWWFMVTEGLIAILLGGMFFVVAADSVDTDEFGFIQMSTLAPLGWVFLIAYVLFSLGVIIPHWAVTLRRLHDGGHTGWWALFYFALPIVVWILALFDSEPRDNKWGADPKADERSAAVETP